MIRIATETGMVDLDASPEGVSIESTRLVVRRGSTTIGTFRKWTGWHERPHADPTTVRCPGAVPTAPGPPRAYQPTPHHTPALPTPSPHRGAE